MITVAFRQQATLRHGDTAGCSHLVVGIFDISDALRIVGYLIVLAIGASIELQQPIREFLWRRDLALTHFSCSLIIGNNRLRLRSTG